jgi:hypothetical protein
MGTRTRWLALPGGLLAVFVVLGTRAAVAPPSGARPVIHDWAAVDDAKLKRTIAAYRTPEEAAALGDDTERAVGHPGLRIHLTMTASQLHYFRTADKKTPRSRHEVSLAFDDGPARTALLKVHGWSTEASDRKSFIVTLFKRQRLAPDCKVKKFILLNLLYDKGAFRMAACNRLLGELGLFPPYFELATVSINGHSEGIYLLVERPEDAIRRTHPNVAYILRRRWMEQAEVKYSTPDIDPTRTYMRLLHAARNLNGARRRDVLSEALDLDQYMTWLGFNSLVQNSDFLDELFLYEVPADPSSRAPLRICAWDYDDIMKPPGHPKQVLVDSLLYACESDIDRSIRDDPELYARFRDRLRQLLEDTLTEAHLTATLDDVQRTLQSIDDGLPSEAHQAQSDLRDAGIERMRRKLLERRRHLLALLATGPTAAAAP